MEDGEARRWPHEKDSTRDHGFDDGRRPPAKECGHSFEAERGEEIISPPEPPKGKQSCQHFDVSLVKPSLDF